MAGLTLPSSAGRVRLSLLSIFATTAVGCTVVAILMWAFMPVFGRYGFVNVFVHAQSIGLATCALAVSSRSILLRLGVTRNLPDLLLLPVVIALGFLVGNYVAWMLLAHPGTAFSLSGDRHMLFASLTTAIVAAGLAKWFFATREELVNLKLSAAHEAKRAEAARRQASEAQLAMLRAQIEPHMLFNTLANLRVLIAEDADRARQMLDQLVDLLRATLAGSRAAHTTLAEEFKVLETYLALMQVRLGDRLGYTLDLPIELAEMTVPSLLLQPVVENAIRHGIEPSARGGQISIRARLQQDLLVLEVCDSGIGCSTAAPFPVKADANGGLGLSILRERVQTLYGAAGRVEIESPRPGHNPISGNVQSVATNPGTAVSVYLPPGSPAAAANDVDDAGIGR